MPSTTLGNAPARARLPVAARDRRPALAALALLLVLVGALGSALVVFRSGDRISVLAATHDIRLGQTLGQGDFHTVRVAADSDVPLLRPSQLASLLREQPTTAIPAGTLVGPGMFTPGPLIPDDGVAVGIVVDATKRPSTMPQPGQVVRVFYVTGNGTSSANVPGDHQVVRAARVLAVGSGGSASSRSVTVLVPKDLAMEVADLASSGNLAVSTLPDDTKPSIDTTTATGATEE
jgi:hypothetical protein